MNWKEAPLSLEAAANQLPVIRMSFPPRRTPMLGSQTVLVFWWVSWSLKGRLTMKRTLLAFASGCNTVAGLEAVSALGATISWAAFGCAGILTPLWCSFRRACLRLTSGRERGAVMAAGEKWGWAVALR